MNYVETAPPLAALTGLFMAVGYAIGRESGERSSRVLRGPGNQLFAYLKFLHRMVLSMHVPKHSGLGEVLNPRLV